MKTILNNLQIDTTNVDKDLLAELQKLNQAAKAASLITEPSKFAINHPLDSNIFKDTIKGIDKSLDALDRVVAQAYSAIR